MTAKVKTIRSSWWEGYGYRLDCQPYLAGALETKIILEKLPFRKDKLHELTTGYEGGIYNGPQFARNYVDSSEYGVPFLGSASMMRADFFGLPLLSKKQAYSDKLAHLEIKEGMTLISCSGTIGKTVYSRMEMEGLWSSQHIMKVVPDSKIIPPGYLYAFLSSKFGIPLIVSGTYGSIIQELEPEHIADIPIPRLDSKIEWEIHDLVEKAAELRTKASAQIRDAQHKILTHFGNPPVFPRGQRHPRWCGQRVAASRVFEIGRLDSFFFNPVAIDIEEWIEGHPADSWQLAEVADVFDVPLFKHIYVDPDFGVGFFTSADIFLVEKKPDKFLSRSETKGLSKYILERGWVLLARSGSLGGNIAIPQFADSAMVGMAASDHVIRIKPKSRSCLPGYLYAYLDLHEIGYPLILRTAAGACVPALWPLYLNRLKVLKPSKELNEGSDRAVQDAFEMRVEATKIEDLARSMVDEALGGDT